jgi:hypothetical protein
MGWHQTEKPLYRKENNQKSKKTIHRMEQNIFKESYPKYSRLIFKIRKQLTLNNKNINNLNKNEQKCWGM